MKFKSHHITFVIIASVLLFLFIRSNAQTLRILPLGNSITAGTDGDPPQEGLRIAYRFTLYSLLTSAGYDFDFVGHGWSGYDIFPDANHGGIPGTRDQYLVRLLQDGYDERWEVQITPGGQPYLDVYPADIILLHIGTNDITHGEGTSPVSVAQILDQIDSWEVRTGNRAIVFVARILNRKVYSLETTQFNNNVAAMVAARNDPDIMMVDIENGAGINYLTDMQDDGIHPYESGYTKMGQKWFEAIQSLNEPPYFTSSPVKDAIEDEPYSYTVTVDDDNPMDELTIIAGSKPSWLSFTDFGDKSGLLYGTPGDAHVGDHPVSLIVSDGKEIATQNFTIRVSNVNDPPRITGQRALETDEDVSVTLYKEDFTIEDVDNPPSDLALIILDGNHYSKQANNVIPDQNYNGMLSVNVRVTDQIDTSDMYYASLQVNPVNDPPVIIGQKHALEVKQTYTLEIQPGDLNYIDIDNNVGELSVILLPDPDTIFLVKGNQLTPFKDTIGTVEVIVMLDDGEDTSNEFSLQVDILPQFSPPRFTTTPPEEAYVNKSYFYVADATDPDGDALSYRTTTLPDWLEFNATLKLLGGVPSVQDTGWVWVGIEVSDGRYAVEQLYRLEVKLYTSAGSDKEFDIDHREGTGLIRKLYPVPAGDRIHVSLAKERGYYVQIIDISGKMLNGFSNNDHVGSEFEIDLNGFDPGVYFIRVFDEERVDTRKFVINR